MRNIIDDLTATSFDVAKAKEVALHLEHKLERLYDKYSEELRKRS